MKMRQSMALIMTFITALSLIGCTGKDIPSEPIDIDQWIVVAGLSTLSFLDVYTGEPLQANLGLGLGANWISEYQNRLYVLNSLSNNLQVFNINHGESSITFNRSVDLGLQENNNPYSADFGGYNNMYITNLMQNSITVLNLNTMQIDTTWQTGKSPEGILYFWPYVYVVNSGYDFSAGLNGHNYGSVYKYSAVDGELLDSVEVGLNPQFVAYDYIGNLLHVTCTGDYGENMGSIHILDGDLNSIDIISVNAYPGRITNIDGQMYVACGGWTSNGDTSGLILSYHPDDLEDIKYISVDNGAMDVQKSRDWSDDVLVTCFDDLSICKIDSDSLRMRYGVDEPPVTLVVVGVAAN